MASVRERASTAASKGWNGVIGRLAHMRDTGEEATMALIGKKPPGTKTT